MRTTIRLPDDLLAKAKRRAAESHRTLTAVIEESLRQALSKRGGATVPAKARLTTMGRGGPQPGIDLSSSAGLFAQMEES